LKGITTLTTVNRYDHINIKAVVTSDGFIRDRPAITRTGIFEYRDKTGRVIKEWRSPEEVFHEDSLASIMAIPITDTHKGLVSSSNVADIIGAVVSPGVKADNDVVADIVIHNVNRLGKKRELSLGYRAEIVTTPGTTPDGQRYDARQTNIRYNHLAVVEKGRAGNARLRLDDNEAVSFDMEDDDVVDAPKLVSVRLDNGLEYQATPEVAQAYFKNDEALKAKTTLAEQLQAKVDLLTQQGAQVQTILSEVIMDGAEKERAKNSPVDTAKIVAEQIKTMPEQLRARSELEATAKKHEIKFDAKTTDRELREGVVTKIRGDAIKFDGKSDDYVSSAYDIALGMDIDKSKKIGDQRVATHQVHTATKQPGGASAARARMVDNIRAGRA
jgi:uncharacterized protein